MRKVFLILVFSVSMGFVQAGVVVYLRDLYYPEGFTFPLKMITERNLIVEIGREAATIFMLISVAALSGKRFWEKFSYLLICFGIWDICYYLWLKLAIGWPSSLLDWDILFLIPLPWVGPVIAPVTISIVMISTGLFILCLYKRGYGFRPSFLAWVLAVIGTLVILYSFMRDTGATLHEHMPLPYRYDALIAGEILYLAAIFFAWRNTVQIATKAPRHTCPPSASPTGEAGGKNRPVRHRPALRDSGEFPNSPEVIPIPPGRGGTRKQAGMTFTPLSEKEEGIARKTLDAVPNAFGFPKM